MDNKVDIWEVIESTKAPLADKEDYVITLLENCNFYEVGLYSGANLIQFIEDDLDINKISSTSDMLKTLSYLKVKFISLANLQDEELLDELININSYQINLENFKIVLKHQDISIGKSKEHKVAYEYCFTDGKLELLVKKELLK